jgi:hypothetical protein
MKTVSREHVAASEQVGELALPPRVQEALGELRDREMPHEYGLMELKLRLATADGEEREISEEDLEGLTV